MVRAMDAQRRLLDPGAGERMYFGQAVGRDDAASVVRTSVA
jgi:hypothetical protein